jgi:nicotinate phosphoribosyltransferase
VFSDSLDVQKIIEIKQRFDGIINMSFGIGTNLTCDVGPDPLNIVIKMTAADPNGTGRFVPTIKLSDSEGKETGTDREIQKCKDEINGD